MKKILSIINLLIIISVIGYFGYFVYTHTAPLSITADTTGLPSGKYTENAKYYDIEANYATSTPLINISKSADETAIVYMKKFVADTIAQFKKDGDFSQITPETAKEMGFSDGRKQALQINYLIASSNSTVSYIFTIYEDTFGAHGNTFFKTFTFNTKTGSVISLSDIFTDNSKYLARLSQISREKLLTILGDMYDANFVLEGTTTESKNFDNFFFDNNDLVILFDPYQVASYVAGPQTLRIQKSILGADLKEEYM